MKKFLLFALFATALAFTSCKFDDSEIWDKFGEHEQLIKDHENRISALEELCKQMNTNISSLQAIIEALQNNDYVTSVIPVYKDGVVIGYTITFTKSQPITIYHGEDGKDGQDGANGQDGKDGKDGNDGYTPQIGVAKDTDGIYYWTIDGKWLLDANGNKVKAVGTDGKDGADGEDGKDGQDGTNGSNGQDGVNGTNGKDGQDGKDGKDGITPRLKIENDYWYVSYDEGKTWTQLGKATGEDGQNGADGSNGSNGSNGDSLFKSVTQDDENVYFTLSDGTVITVPKFNKGDIEKLLERIQSVSYIPRYEDGKATVNYNGTTSRVTLDFEVSPKDAITELAKVWQEAISVKATYTKSRAVSFIDMPIIGFNADTTNGVISVTASGENLSQEFFDGTTKASARLAISDGNNSVTSDYISLVATEESIGMQIPNNEIWYTNGSTTEPTTPHKTDVFVANIVSNTYDSAKECWVLKFDGDITSIGDRAFYSCDSLTSVTIPDSVTSIGGLAFYYCSSLTSIIIPNSVTSIGEYAFYECDSLTSVTIGNSVTSIGGNAFCSCSSLTSITIPDSVTSIGSYAFSYCSSLKSFYGKFASADNRCWIVDGELKLFAAAGLTEYTIPDSVTSIGIYAFTGCRSLTSITIPDSVTSIGEKAFSYCSSLKSFYGKFASADNRCLIVNGVLMSFAPAGLTEYTIPDSVTSIGEYAFYSCYSLTSITIPDSVTSIGVRAFDSCYSLTSITIPNSVTSIGGFAFYVCSSLTSITIPDSVTSIGDAAFYSCSSLISVTIGNSVTSIGSYAFTGCRSLTSVTIGNSVTSIGWYAFSGCTSLTSVYCKPTTPPTGGSGMFSSNASGLTIYVPSISAEAYKSTQYWSDYASDIVGYDF